MVGDSAAATISPEQLEQIEAFLERVAAESRKLIVRWIDEPRIRPHGEQGYTVGHITSVTILGVIDGQLEQCVLDGISLMQIKRVLARRPFEVFYRSDNQTR